MGSNHHYGSRSYSQQDLRFLEWYTSMVPRPPGQYTQEDDFARSTSSMQAGHAGDDDSVEAENLHGRSVQDSGAEPNVASPEASASTAAATAVGAAATANAAASDKGVDLSMLIGYLEAEVAEKELKARAAAFNKLETEGLDTTSCDGLLVGHSLEGQAALDAYISELIAAVRDFPYDKLSKGREAGAWVRDEVIAPTFKGYWDFYSNRKRAGFDLPALHHLFSGENMLLDKLRYVHKATDL